ncbi:MAG: hypothetical protein JXA68_03990 [Ignavibacteriales bacterium]|nr:hypothetical protein [Ignavibacteriales bacterium]
MNNGIQLLKSLFNQKIFFFLLFVIIFLSGCADAIDLSNCVKDDVYGFWGGLWHGIIAPFSFIVSLFDSETVMYACNNNGGWYDLGFVLGAGILFGGGCKATCKR